MEVDGQGRPSLLVSTTAVNILLCDQTSNSPPDEQLQRLMKRDNSSREDASSRINSQVPITEKVEYADHIIDNSGSHQDLERQVNSFLMKVDKEVGRIWWRLSWLIPPFGALSALLMLAWRAIWRPKKNKRKDNS
jgi:dephospho-CoA kinase